MTDKTYRLSHNGLCELYKNETMFTIILRVYYLFHCVDICTDNSKTVVSKTAGAGAKTVASK